MIPSGKLISLAIVSLSIIGVAFYYAEHKNENETEVYTAATNNVTNLNLLAGSSDSYKDTDGDGLKDWEEALWGTDPNVPDAEKAKEAPSTTRSKKAPPLTATDTLGRNIFTQYMNLKQVGLVNDAPSIKQAATNVVESTLAANTGPKIFSTNDFTVSQNISVRDYINAVGGIIKNRTPKITRSEIVIFREALANQDATLLKQLDPASVAYKAMLSDLSLLVVPSTMADLHTRLLNTISSVGYVVDSFKLGFSDPATSIKGLALFQQTFETTVDVFKEYGTIITTQKITFSPEEGGYFFAPKPKNESSI